MREIRFTRALYKEIRSIPIYLKSRLYRPLVLQTVSFSRWLPGPAVFKVFAFRVVVL